MDHPLDPRTSSSNPRSHGMSDGTAANKRRAQRPCDSCRRRKSRCELLNGTPPCVLCQFHHQECTFLAVPPSRKRKATSLSEDEVSTIQGPLRQLLQPPDGELNTTRFAREVTTHSTIQQGSSINYANLKGPSLLKKTLGLQSHRHSRLIGSTSEYEQMLLKLDAVNGKDEVAIGSSALRKVNSSDAFILIADEGTRNQEDEIPDLDSIEALVAPHGKALLHLYFRIVHPSFPILHKKVFLEKYERTHREFSPPLLAAVYIIALHWWSYSSELAHLPKPDVPKLEKLACKAMNDIIYRPKLSTIQAGLLLLQRPEGDSWAFTTQLVGLGQDLGLHLDCSDWRIPVWERGLRKRLGWALFMQDKWGSLIHGRPSHITSTDFAVKGLVEDDFPENAADEDDEDGSTEVEKGRILFCEMMELTKILGVVLSKFYTLRAEGKFHLHAQNDIRWLIDLAKPSQLALRQWYTRLSPSLKMEEVSMRKLSSTGYLHLGYFAVEITLHRRIIRSLSTINYPSHVAVLRSAAQARLLSAMDFVKRLRPEHLQSFWYSASKHCFALIGSFISLLWVTSQDKDEADFYKSRLEEYRWTLRLSSKSADFLEQAITLLATSTDVLVKAIPEQPNPFPRTEDRSRQAISATHHEIGSNSDSESPTYGTLEVDFVPGIPEIAPTAASHDGESNGFHSWFASGDDMQGMDNAFPEVEGFPDLSQDLDPFGTHGSFDKFQFAALHNSSVYRDGEE